MTALRSFLFAWLCLATAPAPAHESLPASLRVIEVAPQRYDVSWRVPATQGKAPAIAPVFPADCVADGEIAERSTPGARLQHWRLRCGASLARGVMLPIAGLAATMVNVQVQLTMQDGRHWSALASPRAPGVALGTLATRQVALGGYFLLGVEHILSGIDHLLFVFCLLLLVPQRWRLVQTITAFTAAHCLTLALAALDVVVLPAPPVEASIALSIVFLAREVLRPAGQGSLMRRAPWLVAFGFGLLHGLGFAGALADIGLPQGEVVQALLLFNLGVEAGQLAFVLAASLLLAALRQWRALPLRRIEQACAYGVGAVATVWLAERVIVVLV